MSTISSSPARRPSRVEVWLAPLLGLLGGLGGLGALLSSDSPLRAALMLALLPALVVTVALPHLAYYLLAGTMIGQWPGQILKVGGAAIGAAVLIWALRRRRHLLPPDPVLWMLVPFVALVGLSALSVRTDEALRLALAWCGYWVFYWTASTLADRPLVAQRLGLVLLLSGVITALIGLVQFRLQFTWIVTAYSQSDPFLYLGSSDFTQLQRIGDHFRIDSITGSDDYMGMAMQLPIPFAVFWLLRQTTFTGRLLGAGMLLALVAALILSWTRGALFIALLVMVPLLAARIGWRRTAPYLLAGALVAGGLVIGVEGLRNRFGSVLQDMVTADPLNAVGWRRAVTAVALEILSHNFWTGVGLDQHRWAIRQYAPSDFVNPVANAQMQFHNAYLWIATELGVIGLLLWVGLLLVVWRQVRYLRHHFQSTDQPRLADLASAAEIAWLALICDMAAYPVVDAIFRYHWVLLALVASLGRIAWEQRTGRQPLPGQSSLPTAPPRPRRPDWAWGSAARPTLTMHTVAVPPVPASVSTLPPAGDWEGGNRLNSGDAPSLALPQRGRALPAAHPRGEGPTLLPPAGGGWEGGRPTARAVVPAAKQESGPRTASSRTGLSRLLRAAGQLFVSRLVGQALGLLAALLVARALGPTDFGLYSLAVVTATLLAELTGAGIDLAAVRVSAGLWTSDPARARGVLLATGLAKLVLGLAVMVLGLTLGGPLVELGLGRPDLVRPLLLGVATGLALSMIEYAVASLQAAQRFGWVLLVNLVTALVRSAPLIGLALGGWLTLEGAQLIFLAGSYAAALVAIWLGLHGWWRQARPRWADLRRTVAVSGWLGLTTLLGALTVNLDLLLLTQLVGAPTVGIYASARTLALPLTIAAGSLGAVMLAQLGRSGEPAAVVAAVRRHTPRIALGALVLAGGGYLIVPPLVEPLLGAQYVAAAPVVGPLLLAAGIQMVVWPSLAALMILDRLRLIAAGSLVVLLLTALGYWLVVPQAGIVGAAWVLVAVYALILIPYLGLALRGRRA